MRCAILCIASLTSILSSSELSANCVLFHAKKNVFDCTRNRHHELPHPCDAHASLVAIRVIRKDFFAVCFHSASGRHVLFSWSGCSLRDFSLRVVVAVCIMAAKAARVFIFSSDSVIEGHLFEDRAAVTFSRLFLQLGGAHMLFLASGTSPHAKWREGTVWAAR